MKNLKQPEILFNPSLIGKEYDGIPIMMMKSINNFPIDFRKKVFMEVQSYQGQRLSSLDLLQELKMKLKNYINKLHKIGKNIKIKININVIDSP